MKIRRFLMGHGNAAKVRIAVAAIVVVYVLHYLSGWLWRTDSAKLSTVEDDTHKHPIAPEVTRQDFTHTTEKGRNMASTTQDEIDYIAENLQVTFKVLSNSLNTKGKYSARVTLKNVGELPLKSAPAAGWSIYFYSIRKVHTMALPGQFTGRDEFSMQNLNGLLYSISPTHKFQGIKPQQTVVIVYTAESSNVARSDNFPNWYVAAPHTKAKTLKSTQGTDALFVSPYDEPARWKRSSQDLYNPWLPAERFDRNQMEDLGEAVNPVIPTPKEFQTDKSAGSIAIEKSKWVVVADKSLQAEVNFFTETTGIKQSLTQPSNKFIKMETSSDLDQESYTLRVEPAEQVIVMSGKPSGLFYATQSFVSLLTFYKGVLSKLHIKDSPRFSHRGLMLDVSRNFFPKETVFKLLDVMSMYKMNKFHFHLTDDEGWRLQIPSLPELTEVGSRRGHDLSEETSILPQLGSGPEPEGLGCGYYTGQDYQDILRYAAQRHVEVIPEIDLPGHSHAAIKAMEVRRKRYLAKGQTHKANEFLLSDPDDKPTYRSVQGYTDNVINPGLESTFKFIETVMTTLHDLHKDIQPLKTFHFGGDEVPRDTWSKSPACKRISKQHPEVKSSSQNTVMKYFLTRTSQIASKLGVNIQGWEDAFFVGQNVPQNRENFPTNINLTTNCWKNVWEHKTAHQAHLLANNGYKVVFSPATHLYLDHPYEPDPEDRGLCWATRFVDVEKVFTFQPDNFYDNIDVTLLGYPMDAACARGEVNCVPLEKSENIIGMQGQLWTETVRTEQQMHEMLFPRLLALAERAWHRAAWESEPVYLRKKQLKKEDYERFSNTVGYSELLRLEMIGIKYHLPLPGVRVENGMLKVNTAHPGVHLKYSSDEGKTWNPLKSFAKLTGKIFIASSTFDGSRQSRAIQVNIE